MEFIHHDGEKLNVFFIDRRCNSIKINTDNEPVTKIYVFTETEGKFITNYSIIKYSKNTLYHYDLFNNIRGIYKFSRFVKETQQFQENNRSRESVGTFSTLAVESSDNDMMLVNEYTVKKGVTVKLLKSTETGDYFIEYLGVSQPVNENHALGKFYTVYTTTDYELQISSNPIRNNKFNGMPISKIT